MNLRRSTISKLFAVWFVVLIVLPFTAPFQTLDLGAPVGKAAAQDLFSANKLSKDTTTTALSHHVVPFSISVVLQVKSLSRSKERRQVLPTVLRL